MGGGYQGCPVVGWQDTEERVMVYSFKIQRCGDSGGNFQVNLKNLVEPPYFIYEENEGQGDVTSPKCHTAGDAETRSLVSGFSTQHYY